jgi:prepilin-type N-terminal cleavage/methylation domain-containing protein
MAPYLTSIPLYAINLSKEVILMSSKEGITLIETIVVLVIIGVVAAFFFPNFTTPTEQARVSNVQNNLLGIYSAQQNYKNSNGGYCYNTGAGTCADSLADLNTNLTLSIADDGTYSYNCPNNSSTCTATRNNSTSTPLMTLTLNTAIQLNPSLPGTNPSCSSPGNTNWCP